MSTVRLIDQAIDELEVQPDVFDPVAKLRVARTEIDELVAEIHAWIRADGHVTVRSSVRKVMPVEGLIRTDHSVHFEDIPSGWARRASRIVADLRSQLDILVFELMQLASEQPLTEDQQEAISFPIDRPDRPQTLEKLRKRFPLFYDETLQAIYEAQPTQDPDGFDHRRTTLWLLNKFNNVDKHRSLNVTGLGTVVSRGTYSQVPSEGELVIQAPDMLGGPCADGCVIEATILLAVPGAERFEHPDGTIEPLVGVCRFLRMAYAVVGSVTFEILIAEGLVAIED